MYAAHFGLRESPFNNTPDPRFFFATPDHEEALASLIYTVEELKGYALLTGEVGVGKTLVSRMMLRHFGDRIASATINNTALSADDLLAAICAEFEVTTTLRASRLQMVRVLQDFLLAQFAANRPVVLVLDEAQNLPHEAFEQIRMIGNLEADDAKLLQIVIVGQPELRGRFAAPNMRQLRQRIFRGFHLPALDGDLCARYIAHRLQVAGFKGIETAADAKASAPTPIFDAAAIDVIQQFSQGLPRPINTACDNALLSAYAAGRTSIDGPFMIEVIAQLSVDSSIDRPIANHAAPPAVAGDEIDEVKAPAMQGLQHRLARLETRMAGIAQRTRRLTNMFGPGAKPVLSGPPPTIEHPSTQPHPERVVPITTGNDPTEGEDLGLRLANLVARAEDLMNQGQPVGEWASVDDPARTRLPDASTVGPNEGSDDRTALRFWGSRPTRGQPSGPADPTVEATGCESFQPLSATAPSRRTPPSTDASGVACPTAALARDIGELAGVIEQDY